MLAGDLTLFDLNDHGIPYFDQVGIVNDVLYYEDTDATIGAELRQIDLVTGVASVVADINPGLGDSYAGSYGGAVVGDKLYFSAYDPMHGNELRVLDTITGVVETIDLKSGELSSNPGQFGGFAAVGTTLYFVAAGDIIFGSDMYVFDTTDNSFSIVDLPSLAPNDGNSLRVIDEVIYFPGGPSGLGNGNELQAFDTTSLTFQTFDIRTGSDSSSPRDLIVAGSKLFFTAEHPDFGREPMILDSADNTITTFDINTGVGDSTPRNVELIGSKVYFNAFDPTIGQELQILDTTDNSLQTIDVNPNPGISSSARYFAKVGSKVYFTSFVSGVTRNILAFDETNGAVTEVQPADNSSEFRNVYGLTAIGSKIYFTGADAVFGEELRVIDTSFDTYSTIDLLPGDGSSFAGEDDEFLPFGDSLFVVANTAVNDRALFKLDSTDDSWLNVAEINNGHVSSQAGRYGGFATVNGKVYSVASNPVAIHVADLIDGSITLLPFNNQLVSFRDTVEFKVVGTKIYFSAVHADFGNELHVLDTTDHSLTTLDINAGPASSNAAEFGFAQKGNKLYFTASDTTYGAELRVLDTTDDSYETVDMIPGSQGAIPGQHNGYEFNGDKLIFMARDAAFGQEMRILDTNDLSWTTVNTAPGNANGSIWWGMSAVANKMAFAALDANGVEFRVVNLDDNSVTTFDIRNGAASSDAGRYGGFVTIGSKVYFSARNDSNQILLYEYNSDDDSLSVVPDSDFAGSRGGFAVVGPNLVYDTSVTDESVQILNSTDGSVTSLDGVFVDGSDIYALGSRVYFDGYAGGRTGSELIEVDVSDKSFSTIDINSGLEHSDPGDHGGFANAGSTLIFDARKQGFGDELFAFDSDIANGDFNGDGQWTCEDIDALTETIASGVNDPAFDMTGDAVVDLADRDAWLAQAGGVNLDRPYSLGDANLDGHVDVSDFNIWNTHKFSLSAAWCDGDFDANGAIEVSDYNIWNSAKFSSAPSPVEAATQQAANGRELVPIFNLSSVHNPIDDQQARSSTRGGQDRYSLVEAVFRDDSDSNTSEA